MDDAKYQFVGDGDGVAGLPREISQMEADAQGVGELLTAAIANGNYQAAASGKKKGPPPAPPVAKDATVGETDMKEQ